MQPNPSGFVTKSWLDPGLSGYLPTVAAQQLDDAADDKGDDVAQFETEHVASYGSLGPPYVGSRMNHYTQRGHYFSVRQSAL
jgi:hypothetical protein